MGCPNDCVFCNQRTISGHGEFDPSGVRNEIETALETLGDRTSEIAFFGGSFTGIDRELMVYLLDIAEEYVRSGRVSGIRMSTRPDYINAEIIEILKKYTVAAVELGIQSTDERVLLASKRGHTKKQSETAVRLLTEAGFSVVGQMMLGLPKSTRETEIQTARDICSWGVSAARVYPTVVFKKTALCRMAEQGDYTPLTDAETVSRTADVLDVFDRRGVNVIRVGLQSSENLSSEEEVYGGANHPAIGELSMNELYFRRICEAIGEQDLRDKNLTVYVARGSVSKAVGQKRNNILRLREKYGVNVVKILEKSDILGYNIRYE